MGSSLCTSYWRSPSHGAHISVDNGHRFHLRLRRHVLSIAVVYADFGLPSTAEAVVEAICRESRRFV